MTLQPSKGRAQRALLPLTLVLLTGLAATTAHAGGIYSDLAAYTAAAGAGSTPVSFADVTVPNNNTVDTFSNATSIAANRYDGWNLPNATVVGTNYAFGVAAQALIEDTTGPLTLNLTNSNVSAVGFNLAVFGGGPATVSVFDGTTKLASASLTVGDETQLTDFFGYVGTAPITSVTIAPTGFGQPLALANNLQYSVSAVPEPVSAALAACGLVFLAGVRRRR